MSRLQHKSTVDEKAPLVTTPHHTPETRGNKQRFLTPGHQGWNDLHRLCRIGMEYYLPNNDNNSNNNNNNNNNNNDNNNDNNNNNYNNNNNNDDNNNNNYNNNK